VCIAAVYRVQLAVRTAEPYERVTISLPKVLLERIDAHNARSRSAAVRALVEQAFAGGVKREHELVIDVDDTEYAVLEAYVAVNGGTAGDAVRHALRHTWWIEECRRRGLPLPCPPVDDDA
jgi:hypothetical protein